MAIKSDRWIRQMASEQGMIEPFVEGQVRAGVISYGLSSYGYDIRVADEFKIFTSATGELTVVDPKQFDQKGFVDFRGDVCIIPPNSFALARTVEHFRIPRDVLCICMGKSTYARCGLVLNVTPLEPCYSEDTQILTDHGWKYLRDVEIGTNVLGMRENGHAEWQPVERKQVYPYDGELLHFDGKSIDLLVTPEHKVLVRKRIIERGNTAGYFTPWHTIEAKDVHGKYNFEMSRRVVWDGTDVGDTIEVKGMRFPTDPFLEFLGMYLGDGSCNYNKGGYIVKLAAFKGRELEIGADILGKLGVKYSRIDSGYQFFSKTIYELFQPLGHAHEKYIPEWVKNLPPHRLEHLLYGLMNSDGNNETETYTTTSARLADDIQEVIFKAGYGAVVRNCGLGEAHEFNGQVIRSNHPVYKIRISRSQLDPKTLPQTHKLVAYQGLVYDVTVPGHLIFVRRNGKAVWSGNCWEGYVTLEISNTTPLPAKIYANEGIGQVLFFQSDEPCEVSYADRRGKYQGQQGVTPPKLS